MKQALTLLLPLVFACTRISAQCAQPYSKQIVCGSNTCSQQQVVNGIEQATYGYFYDLNSITCCGQNVPSYGFGATCEATELRDPEIRNKLFEASKTRNLLIASCSGIYQPFLPARVRELTARNTTFDLTPKIRIEK